MTVLEAVVAGMLGCFGVSLVHLAFKILRSDKASYSRNQKRSGNAWEVLRGRTSSTRDGVRDYCVQAGLGVDPKNNAWIEKGMLSKEAVDTVLNPQGK